MSSTAGLTIDKACRSIANHPFDKWRVSRGSQTTFPLGQEFSNGPDKIVADSSGSVERLKLANSAVDFAIMLAQPGCQEEASNKQRSCVARPERKARQRRRCSGRGRGVSAVHERAGRRTRDLPRRFPCAFLRAPFPRIFPSLVRMLPHLNVCQPLAGTGSASTRGGSRRLRTGFCGWPGLTGSASPTTLGKFLQVVRIFLAGYRVISSHNSRSTFWIVGAGAGEFASVDLGEREWQPF